MPDSNIVSEILAEFLAALKKDGSLPKEVSDAIETSVAAGTLGHPETVRTLRALSRQVTRED